MKALTTRKPIALTTTSLCSGAFTARIARTQRLQRLRIAGFAVANWEQLEHDANSGRFKTYGLDVYATRVAGAAEAADALVHGAADVAFIDTLTAVRAYARQTSMQFVAMCAGMDPGFVALTDVIDARHYALARFTRGLRENGYADYVDSRGLQRTVDRFAAEKLIAESLSAQDLISRIGVISGTR